MTAPGTSPTRTERVRDASRRRRAQEKASLRAAILAAAAEVFVEAGDKGFSLRAVAERIGYSATTIYLYFDNKDDLLFAVLDEGFRRFLDVLLPCVRDIDAPVSRLAALGRTYIRFGLENRAFYRVMFMERPDFLYEPREGESTPPIASFRVLRDTVQAAVDTGAFRAGDVDAYTDALWATVHGVVSLAITLPDFDARRVERLGETAIMATLEGLGAR